MKLKRREEKRREEKRGEKRREENREEKRREEKRRKEKKRKEKKRKKEKEKKERKKGGEREGERKRSLIIMPLILLDQDPILITLLHLKITSLGAPSPNTTTVWGLELQHVNFRKIQKLDP